MYENLSEDDRRWAAGDTEPTVGCRSKPGSQLRDGMTTQTCGSVVQCSVWSEAASDDVTAHRDWGRLSQVDQVPEYVTNPPFPTPRWGFPGAIVQRFDAICDLATQEWNLSPDIRGLHGDESVGSQSEPHVRDGR